MASRLSDQAERWKDFRQRHLPGQLAQLALAGTLALVILVAAVISLPRSRTDIAASGAGPATGVGATAEDSLGGSDATSRPGGSAAEGPGSAGGGRGAAGRGGDGAATTIGGAPAAPPGVNARGVTAKEILVGDAYDVNQGCGNQAFGVAGIGQIDLKRATETVVKYINDRGGVAGRRLKIVWHRFDSCDPNTNSDKLAQEICTDFTQDRRVFVSMVGGTDTYNACFTKAGIPSIVSGGVGESDSKTFKQNPYFIGLGGPAYDRIAQLMVDELRKVGYYSRPRTDTYGAALGRMPFKLGVVTYDAPAFDRAVGVYRKALARHNIKLSEVASIKRAGSIGELGDEVAATQQAALRFKNANVTHVQFLSTPNGLEQLNFWAAADNQRYYPRYGLTSNDPAQALKATLESHASSGAFTRTFQQTVGVGWTPLFDVGAKDYTGARELPALRQCKKILAHEKYDDSSRNKEAQAAVTCDPFFYLKAALDRGAGRGAVNQRTFLNGVANVGSVPSAWTFDMKTTATRHDGMSAIRNYAFGDDDSFHYTSGIRPV